jgi:hypothetical protein
MGDFYVINVMGESMTSITASSRTSVLNYVHPDNNTAALPVNEVKTRWEALIQRPALSPHFHHSLLVVGEPLSKSARIRADFYLMAVPENVKKTNRIEKKRTTD